LDSLATASTSANVHIQDDELVEVTPKSIRLRKTVLDPNDRKRAPSGSGWRKGWRGHCFAAQRE
jgi:hypothetical protein